MKKFLVLFVGLAILAGSVCALDLPDALKIPGLVVTGNVRTGFRVSGGTWADYEVNGVKVDDSGDHHDPVAYAYSDDPDNGAPLRAQLQLVWTRGNLGVKTRFRYQPNNGNLGNQLNETALLGDAFFVNKAFVWGDVLNQKVRLTVGKEQDAAWGLFWSNLSGSDTDQYDGKDGAKIEVKPIDGLNLGLFYGAGDIFQKAFQAKDAEGNNVPGYTTANTDPLLVAGAKYSTDNFGVTASLLHRFNFADETVYEGIQTLDNAEPNTSNLLVGLKLSPSGLPLTVNANLGVSSLGAMTKEEHDDKDPEVNETATDYKGGDYNPYTFFYAKLNAEYGASDALSVGLTISDIQVGSQYYYDEGDADDPGLGRFFPITLSPYVNYAINDDVEVGGELSFKINKNGTDQFGFGLKPSATFQLGSGASFNVYDELVFYGASKYHADEDPDYRNKHPGIASTLLINQYGASGTENTFHIEFGWSF
jgi:hypothetical protein